MDCAPRELGSAGPRDAEGRKAAGLPGWKPGAGATWLRDRGHHLAAALLLLCFYTSLAWLAVAPWRLCQVDEPGWLSSGYRTWQLAGGLASPARWSEAYAEAKSPVFFELYPPVGKLLVGASVALHRRPDDPVEYRWDWPQSYAANLAAGNLPPAPLLRSVRLDLVALATSTLALVYVAAVQVTGARWLALLAPTLLFLSPIFRIYATQVYMEGPQIFLLAAAVVAFNDHLRRRRRASFAAALVLMGLACATKLNSAPLVLAAGVFCALRPAPLATRLRRSAAVAIIPFAVFCAVNPYVWAHPVAKLGAFVSGWSEVKARQQLDPQLAPRAVRSPAQGIALTARETIARPTLYHPRLRSLQDHARLGGLVVAAGLALALRRYRFDLQGLPRPWGAPALGVLAALGVALWLGGALGLPALLLAAGLGWRLAVRASSRRGLPDREPAAFVASCALAMLVVTGLWLPHDWARYYLPTLVLLPSFYVAGAQLAAAVAATRTPRQAT